MKIINPKNLPIVFEGIHGHRQQFTTSGQLGMPDFSISMAVAVFE